MSSAKTSHSWGNHLLGNMVETEQPQAISFWPDAWGWQLLLLCLLGYLLYKLCRAVICYQHNAYRREALAWLDNLPPFSTKSLEQYQQIALLLRACALNFSSREEISDLSGQAWELWLDKQCPSSTFSTRFTGKLHWLTYQCAPKHQSQATEVDALAEHARHWITHHRGKYD